MLAAVIAGLALLFFTERQKGKVTTTFRNAAWVLVGVVLLGPITERLDLRSLAKAPAAAKAPVHAKLNPPPALPVSPVAAPAKAAAPSNAARPDRDEWVAAIDAVLASARADGSLDYSKDLKAAKLFDSMLALRTASPGGAGLTPMALARLAHQDVLYVYVSPSGSTERQAPDNSALTSETDACPTRRGDTAEVRRSRLTKARAYYSDLSGKDDVAVVLAVHRADYSDMPVQCVAEAFGVALPDTVK